MPHAKRFYLPGGLFLMAIVSDSLYALLAGGFTRCLKGTHGLLRRGRYMAGGVYLGLGITTALSGPSRN